MINKKLYDQILSKKDFDIKNLDLNLLDMKATREGFGEGLLILGKNNNKVVALCADLTESVQMDKFKNAFPDRFFEMGIAEQNMVSVASGMAAMGKLPVAASYAAFNPGRNWEQIRTTICYNNRKVIIVGAHSGLTVGPDGGTHQALEDVALMRVLPNMTVLIPADSIEAKELIIQAESVDTPVYIRLTREKSPVIFDENYKPQIGKSEIIYTSPIESVHKVGIIASGPIIFEALLAAKELEKENIFVQILKVNTIKPIEKEKVIEFSKNNKKRIITLEEHQINGGLGSLVSEILSEEYPSIVRKIGVQDRFGQSGTVKELYKEYNIDKDYIIETARKLVNTFF